MTMPHPYNHLLFWLSALGKATKERVSEICCELAPEKRHPFYSLVGPLSRLGHVEFNQHLCVTMESSFMLIQKSDDQITGVFCGRRDGFLLDSLKTCFDTAFITEHQEYGSDLWQLTSTEADVCQFLQNLSITLIGSPADRLLCLLPSLSQAMQQIRSPVPVENNELHLVAKWHRAVKNGQVFVRHDGFQKKLEIEPRILLPVILDRLLRSVSGRCPATKGSAWIYSGIQYNQAHQVVRIMETTLEQK